MPALVGRIKRLESRLHSLAGPCSMCGRLPRGGAIMRPHALSYSFEEREPAWCPRCGQSTVYVLTLEDPTEHAP